MLRVIAGELKGRRLTAPKDNQCRPTLDRVKESIFNVLGADIFGRRVLDLFCGSASLGIEALSRGATEAVFVDSRKQVILLARKNISALGLDKRASFILSDILKSDRIEFGAGFDLVFADPPYEMMVGNALIDLLTRKETLASGGLLIFERSRQETVNPKALTHLKLLKFGQTEVDIFIKPQEA
jgi:16S rRNA (guanine(966)-N(2))-methyltransferase RsmD